MKVKIVNRKRFMRSTGILLAIIIFTVIICTQGTVFSHKESKYKVKYISNGETLWNIAKQEQNINSYYNNKDIREIIESIKSTNNLESTNLNINQKIIIPTI